jgi:hypothetical protein
MYVIQWTCSKTRTKIKEIFYHYDQ